ncbi:hypothetical protein [Tahibacter sp.]|uniref:hypothetical protein n=1 Tax=Tahibacter sp. TaxID=2056211 RepID=UPI0028C4CFF3|nr:hypothetical protein [Tahibacter sp.]
MITARRQRRRGLARIVVVAGAVLITGTALRPLWRADGPPSHGRSPDVVASGVAPVASRAGVEGAAALPAQASVTVDAALLDTPEARAYLEREQFNDRARRFFADATHSDAPADPREAQWIEAEIGRYERERHMSAGEAMNLRLGLIEASGLSDAERAERMAAIVTAYGRDGERREAQWVAQQRSDAAFVQYKSREQVIVAEVMAMARIPDGLSRDEYLRRRLEAERIAAMR